MDLAIMSGEQYFGKANITFKMNDKKDVTQPLFLDFLGSKVQSLVINGKPSDPKVAFNGNRIQLDQKLMKPGQVNVITMNILNKYRSDGTGLHSFTDHTDNNQYLFTQFEVDNCHFVMPVFDQPDLRANLILNTIAPKQWVVISNERDRVFATKEVEELKNSLTVVGKALGVVAEGLKTESYKCDFFEQTPQISTYLYAIVAGPYGVHEYQGKAGDGLVPMRLYARQSMMKYLGY